MAYDFRLNTPEIVALEYEPAGIGSRFLAATIDSLLMMALGIGLTVAVIGLGTLGLGTAASIVGLTGAFLILWGYYVFFETWWRGQTPGKRNMGIRVLKTTGYPIGFMESLIRNLIRFVDFLPSFYGIGFVTMFISPQARRLGDYAAGTIVVKERLAVTLDELQAAPQPASAAPPVSATVGTQVSAAGELDPDELSWQIRTLTSAQLEVAREFVRRAPELPPATRARLGGEIAGRIAATIGAREPFDAASFLARVLALHGREPAPPPRRVESDGHYGEG